MSTSSEKAVQMAGGTRARKWVDIIGRAVGAIVIVAGVGYVMWLTMGIPPPAPDTVVRSARYNRLRLLVLAGRQFVKLRGRVPRSVDELDGIAFDDVNGLSLILDVQRLYEGGKMPYKIRWSDLASTHPGGGHVVVGYVETDDESGQYYVMFQDLKTAVVGERELGELGIQR